MARKAKQADEVIHLFTYTRTLANGAKMTREDSFAGYDCWTRDAWEWFYDACLLPGTVEITSYSLMVNGEIQ